MTEKVILQISKTDQSTSVNLTLYTDFHVLPARTCTLVKLNKKTCTKEHNNILNNDEFNDSGKTMSTIIQIMSTFFFYPVFFHKHSQSTGQQGKGEAISLSPLYHYHPLHKHLDISRTITAERSPLHIASSWARTGNLWLPSTNH